MLLMQDPYVNQLLYDVSDPVHPRLLCKISFTTVHLVTGDTFEYLKPRSETQTDVILHSLGSGKESVVGKFPFSVNFGSWLPDLSVMAYTILVTPDNANYPDGGVQVWLYSERRSTQLFTYKGVVGGCICRFGLPPPVLAISPDGQYVVAGPGKGSEPLAIYRVSDRTQVTALPEGLVFWDRTGHRLFMGSSSDSEQVWTPEAGVLALKGAHSWVYRPALAPDGGKVAYTAYLDPDQRKEPRVYVYDLKSATTSMLLDKRRSQALFVKSGWVWYLEEALCDPSSCGPLGTQPTGKVFAMQLSSGTETALTFAAGENPLHQDRPDQVTWPSFAPGELWPAS
jgi:Tol biopolymer transport system component